VIDSSTIDAQGYFHFSKTLPRNPKFYYLFLDGRKNKIQSKKFLLSNQDSIFFQKSTSPLSKYKNSSLSDKEWQKLLAFEKRMKKGKKFLDEIRAYSKDSLQILAVKLISMRELDQKQLLDKDIALNKEYYAVILNELKESDINPQEYLFLELKLTKLQIINTEESYAMSKWLNYILGFIILGILFFVYRTKNSKQTIAPLSKQELAIKELILEEKSNKEIAIELFISVSTVKTHITNIYQKLQVANRNDLMTRFKNSTGTST
jgi:ATP/maltotriose-dependent transcriptional regulator MalT